MDNLKKLAELQQRIQYYFQDESLLRMALQHSSYTNENHIGRMNNNERLEFLGDAVLELVSSEFLYENYPDYPEGKLTRMRASLVCEPTLAFCTKEIDLGNYLLLGKGEESTGGRERNSIVSDAMEALIGAIYLDGGFANAKEFILRFVLNDLEHKQLFFDSKTILQEMVQGEGKESLVYELLEEKGPDHAKIFSTRVLIGNREAGRGTGRTKKASEQQAAYAAIMALRSKQD